MIKRLFRWIHWRARARYWRHRALEAEASLEAERWRNLEREDTLVTVPMRMAGLWGMPARSAPATPLTQVNRIGPNPISAPTDPWHALSWADKNEFEMFWKADAEAAGVPLQQARQQFLAELASRRTPLNDDPFGAN